MSSDCHVRDTIGEEALSALFTNVNDGNLDQRLRLSASPTFLRPKSPFNPSKAVLLR